MLQEWQRRLDTTPSGSLNENNMKPVTKTITVLLTTLLFSSQAYAQSFTRTYEHGPIPLDTSANLSFTIDLRTRTAYLGLRVSAELSTQTWVGIGISEPTSGSMLGADIATVQFLPDSNDECELTDRHVPFVPYPLLTSGGGAPPVWPEEDDCQGGWTLVSCQRDAEKGVIILEVWRSLDADEPQDRDIVSGENNVIYAFGSSFGYHVGNRASARVSLYGDGPIGDSQPLLPDDVEDNFTITATNYAVNDQKVTVYACTSVRIPVEKGKKRMIVAAEPVLNATFEEHVHHLTLFLCRGAEYAELIEKTVECTTGEDIFGPLGNPLAGCRTFVYGWAKGIGRFVLPEEAGFIVDEENSYLVMETHYDNPDLESNAFDNSGVRLYLTDTLREHEAGSILLGDSLVQLIGETVESGFKYQFTCPTECTQKFSQPVNLFSSFLHMHRTGMEIYNNRFSSRQRYIETINKVNFWSDSFQNQVRLDKRLRPGDQLQLTCLYDTRKLPETKFGLQTEDEMCMDFVGYWPVQRVSETNDPINICAFGTNENATFTFCGDLGSEFELGTSILPGPNPAFNDRRGSPTDFGNTPDTCPVETDELAETPTDSDGSGSGASTDAPTPAGGATGEPPVVDTEDEGVCFPSWARVTTLEGQKRMDELQVGDEVLVASGKFSPIFMFTHKDQYTRHLFVRLTTKNQSITMTRGHYLYANDELRRADMVKVGDQLRLGNGEVSVVTNVATVWDQGLYNPHTLHGDIVVDGIVATCYTVRVAPWSAHALLAPLRWAFGLVGIDAFGVITSLSTTA